MKFKPRNTTFSISVCCYISLVVSARNIYLSYFVDHTGKQDNFYEICLPLFPSLILFSISVFWALYSPGNIVERDPRLYLYTMGTVFSNIACKLIIAQMCNTRAELFNLCLAMYSIVAVTSLSGFLSAYQELIFLRFAVVVITLAHLHFGICVVRQLCGHFKIHAFSLRYLQQSSKKSQ
ncbi:unnamed protein product [Brugia pahangi]|uniref:Uncharacterized protein n=1 Tax=Brugia pahangi TaxID=6280 RepID=A0A0N4T952_BRUPA|nr:unnamed protein product [Brugia pahangi]